MKKKDLIGRRVVGFFFKGHHYNKDMNEQVGIHGTINEITGKNVKVYFEEDNISWYYPLKKVKKNLVRVRVDLSKIIERAKTNKKAREEREQIAEFTLFEIADIIDVPVEMLRIKL
tara:strand:- start:285 stop:632 length:348 start_codon:yes stop_codon:yes gene_type:complete